MSNNSQHEFSHAAMEKQNVLRETEDKEKIEDSNRADKQKTSKRRQERCDKKLENKMSQKSVKQPDKTIVAHTISSETLDKVTIPIEPEDVLSSVETIKGCQINHGIPSMGQIDTSNFLSVGESSVYHGGSHLYGSNGKTFPSQGLRDQTSATSTPAVNKEESFDTTEVPYEMLNKTNKIPLAIIGPSSTTASEDASDLHCPSDLTDPEEDLAPTRYDNNSSYAAAIKGGPCLSLSESWKGALETSCSSSIQGSNESLKHDNSHDDHTLRSNISAASASPKISNRHDTSSPSSVGNVVIPIITTSGPGKSISNSPSALFKCKRKLSQESRLARQQSQPSPKEQRCTCRGFRRSISNRVTTSEGRMLQHGGSWGGIGTEEKSGCCFSKHHCCSLHNCDTSTHNYYLKENQREQHVCDGASCDHLHTQNEQNCPFQCHHGHQLNRICRHGACRETTTHIIGSGMCINQATDSIATIAADSLKFKGATKKFNQVNILIFLMVSCSALCLEKPLILRNVPYLIYFSWNGTQKR